MPSIYPGRCEVAGVFFCRGTGACALARPFRVMGLICSSAPHASCAVLMRSERADRG